ncbi:protease modulator HflC [Croceibacterium sp. LX-88]|uniref:Protein HflC n=1 Tax=Croceibacterium selenioxidans TaxID=2838833 RepID=A0ABS5W6B3_9SPHN|nr:protease modulator HflC [Croceibacterium selenioxidans]MBT2134887.1 protease modulator HflC [Croceibacterium selenioxidans]
MQAVWETHKLSIIAVAVLVVAFFSSVIIVPETKQAVVIRTGEPVRTINRYSPNVPFGQTNAGLSVRIPFFERVQMIDRRVLDIDMERQEVLSSDQQRLQVDAYARFRIVDPVKMVQNAGTEENVATQLQPILASVLRQELGRRTFASMLTAERGAAMTNIRNTLDTQARQYGAQVIDVRIKRADLPEGTPLEAAFRRMETDRKQEAETTRAGGQRDAQIVRAGAEAQAARIYAEAYGKDPQFYDFYRAMESYRRTFEAGEGESSIILSPDNDYLRQFRSGGH